MDEQTPLPRLVSKSVTAEDLKRQSLKDGPVFLTIERAFQ